MLRAVARPGKRRAHRFFRPARLVPARARRRRAQSRCDRRGATL